MNPDGGNPANDAAGEGDEDHERYGYLDFPEFFECIGNIAITTVSELLECCVYCLLAFEMASIHRVSKGGPLQ